MSVLSAQSLTWLAITICVSAFIQGMSGLGFSLVAAPVVSQVVPGTQGIGLVNLLAFFQNMWQVWRETGVIHWAILRRLSVGIVCGFTIGFVAIVFLSDNVRPLVVAASSLCSLFALLWWRPKDTTRNAGLSGAWGASVNTYAGVGGPPVASFLIRQDWDHSSHVRTQQIVFAVLNAVSIPLLGLPNINVWLISGAMLIIAVGASSGIFVRRFVNHKTAVRISEVMIFVVASLAFVRAIIQLFV